MSILRISHVSKQFPGTLALDDVSVEFESGKVNALIGKNGSGKSTLVKIINGAQPATSGKIYLDDRELDFDTPEAAIEQGISTVYQELSLIAGLSVAENILLGRFPMKGKFIDWKETYGTAQKLLDGMGIEINAKTPVHELSMWQCQMVEIAKAMSTQPKVILLDEPTSSLSKHETQTLFRLIRELKKQDVIIIYISHRLHELWEIADTCTVLRDGELIGKVEMAETQRADIISMMFGEVTLLTRPEGLGFDKNETVLSVEGLCGEKFQDVSFELRRGEILGIAGMLGAGRTELLRAVFGVDQYDRGTVTFMGKRMKPNPVAMKQMGMGLTPEDRKLEGLIQIMSIRDNLCVASLDKLSGRWFMNRSQEQEAVERQVKRLQIKASDLRAAVSELSGGNQQKVVIGNWLNNAPTVMLFDEPSRGIDVNAKQQIFKIIWELSAEGISSIVVSSELEELLEVCHRIIIMRYGRFCGELQPEDTSVEALYSICMGGNDE